MGDIVNLRQARKANKRKQAVAAAAENRVRFGQTKAQRLEQSRAADRAARLIDGAKREKD